MILFGAAGAVLAASAHPEGGVQIIMTVSPPPATDARSDFNGDGRSDIFWRSNAGVMMEWLGQSNGSFADNPLAGQPFPLDWYSGGADEKPAEG